MPIRPGKITGRIFSMMRIIYYHCLSGTPNGLLIRTPDRIPWIQWPCLLSRLLDRFYGVVTRAAVPVNVRGMNWICHAICHESVNSYDMAFCRSSKNHNPSLYILVRFWSIEYHQSGCPHGFHMPKNEHLGPESDMVGWVTSSAYLTNHLRAVQWIWIPYPPSLWDDPCPTLPKPTQFLSLASTTSTFLLTTQTKSHTPVFTLVI